MQAVAQTILNSCSELPGCRLKCRQEPAGLLNHQVPVALCGLIPAFTICGSPCPVSSTLQPARGSCYSSSRNPHPRALVLSRAMILYRAITSATSLQSQVSLAPKHARPTIPHAAHVVLSMQTCFLQIHGSLCRLLVSVQLIVEPTFDYYHKYHTCTHQIHIYHTCA